LAIYSKSHISDTLKNAITIKIANTGTANTMPAAVDPD